MEKLTEIIVEGIHKHTGKKVALLYVTASLSLYKTKGYKAENIYRDALLRSYDLSGITKIKEKGK